VWGEELVLITPRRFARIRAPRDFGHVTLIAFANGCDYRRPLEAWLGAGHLTHERVPGFGSYHAIVACVASGAGIAIVPRSVVRVSRAEDNVATSRPAVTMSAYLCTDQNPEFGAGSSNHATGASRRRQANSG